MINRLVFPLKVELDRSRLLPPAPTVPFSREGVFFSALLSTALRSRGAAAAHSCRHGKAQQVGQPINNLQRQAPLPRHESRHRRLVNAQLLADSVAALSTSLDGRPNLFAECWLSRHSQRLSGA